MKILQIIQRPQLRGAEIFACQLSAELQTQGMEVHVAYLFGELPGSWPFKLKFIDLKGVQKRRFWDFNAYRNINSVIRQGQYDLVQANAGDTLKYTALSKFLFGWTAPLVYRNANKMSGFFRNGLHRRLTSFFLAQCDFFISVSENCRIDLSEVFAKAKDRSVTITIGTYLFDETPAFTRKDHSQPVLINIGSFVPEKNHLALIHVFNSFYRKHQRGFLWLVGDGKLRKTLEEKVRSLELEERVVFWGYRNDVISILKSADVLVMPSLIEGIPGVILESMGSGVPVVASNVGGIPEVVENNVTGFAIHPIEESLFLEKIEMLLTVESFRSEIVENAKRAINKKFLMPLISQKFFGQYKTILKLAE